MASEFFDVALGKFVGMAEQAIAASNDQIEVLLLKVAEADADLRLHASVSDIFAAAGNTEADATNYAKVTGIPATINATVTQQRDVDIPDISWLALGGALNNATVKLIVAFQNDPGGVNDDTTLIPVVHYTFLLTTDGSDVVVEVNVDGITRSGACP